MGEVKGGVKGGVAVGDATAPEPCHGMPGQIQRSSSNSCPERVISDETHVHVFEIAICAKRAQSLQKLSQSGRCIPGKIGYARQI